jgi:Uma2 family endonuclease
MLVSSAHVRAQTFAEERWSMLMAVETRPWTIEDLDRFPEDGNTYEVVRGELFVSPPPTFDHDTVIARLTHLLVPYVTAHDLGYVYHPRGVIRYDGSQVEPDIVVRPHASTDITWDSAPTPLLVVEILSRSTQRRDRGPKRALYLEAGIPEYWIVDRESRSITAVRHDAADATLRDTLVWSPTGTSEPLTIELTDVFGAR